MKAVSSSIVALAGAVLISDGAQPTGNPWVLMLGLVVGGIGFLSWIGFCNKSDDSNS